MKIRGKVFSGAMRGGPLIEKYYARLIGILGVRVFVGTLDVQLERKMDIRPYARKTIEHVLPGGTKKNIDAYIAEVKLRKMPVSYSGMELRDNEKESIKRLEELKKTAKDKMDVNVSEHVINPGYECWAIQFICENMDLNVVEIVAKDRLRDKLDLHDQDTVEIEFFERK